MVIDANILFAALIKESVTADIIISNRLQLFAPEFLFEEFFKYEKLILEKTHRSKEEFNQFLNILKERIIIIPQEIIIPFLGQAEKISPDPKDNVYLALALAIKSNIWSNHRKLKEEQDDIKVLTTEDVVKFAKLIK